MTRLPGLAQRIVAFDVGLRLEVERQSLRRLHFQEFGGSPGNSYTWVELHDDLTVSLLQARLIELNLPIDIAIGTRD